MGRTHVNPGSDELELLDPAAEATGAFRSELIRRAVRAAYGRPAAEDRLAALRSAAGLFKDRNFTGAQYAEAIRGGDVNERLRRLG